MVLPPTYKIHPGIGISRLGNATNFFIGPEMPGLRPTGEVPGTKVPPYKEGGKIKPQAARFHIFEYTDKGGDYVVKREVSLSDKDVTKLVWTVHLANRKASFFTFKGMEGEDRLPTGKRNSSITVREKLEIDPKQRSISGKNAGPVHFNKGSSTNPTSELWPDPKPSPEITTLGKLLTDSEGRLLVIGGSGKTTSISGAAPISTYANNDGWFDDVSDGPVTAHLELKSKAVIVDPAWVICGPPDFAPHIENVVTLYDTLFDTAARLMTIPPNEEVYKRGALKGLAEINREFKAIGGTTLSSYKPNYATEIYPILARAMATKYVFAPSVGHHSPPLFDLKKLGKKSPANAANRQAVLAWIRDPNTPSTQNWPYMPKLLGDEPYKLAGGVIHKRVRLTVTPTQYALLQQWASGKFNESTSVPPPIPTKLSITPEGLDRAALENCVGGAFFPGIEVGWQMRNQLLFSSPFRIKHGAPSQYISEAGKIVKAGHFTRQMALPWQADFLQCKAENDTSGVFTGLGLFGWWPAQRPDSVFASEADLKAVPPRTSFWHRATSARARISWPSGNPDLPSYDEMLNNWTKFGFIIEKKKDVFIEDQREADIP